jgi:nitrite reductase/ring-hydroxylating ferredoxin subunit
MVAIAICSMEELADPGSRAFTVGSGDWPLKGFLVRRGERVFAYVNQCPHAGHPLNWHPHEFLTRERTFIQCGSHGAIFEISTGACVAGPCNGKPLRSLPVEIREGIVYAMIADEFDDDG